MLRYNCVRCGLTRSPIMAFIPMLLQAGATSSVAAAIAWIVILCLAFSLVESTVY